MNIEKLEKAIDCEQFKNFEKSCDIVVKFENELNKEFSDIRKKGEILVKAYEALSFTGAQPARFYGLAKVLKKETSHDKSDTPRKTMKRLLELAVPNVYFKSNESWYCQKDGLAMGASLAVFLANLWMKSWEPQLKLQTPICKTDA